MKMHEVACNFGTESALVGVYTHTQESQQDQDGRPVVLLLNSGLLSNVGPYRLYVRLARHFSNIGFNTFRFDISGIGDSERRSDNLARDKQQVEDIQVAMDYIQRKFNKRHFVVMGICTGADNAHRAMLADTRIRGAVGIDGYYFKTPRYYFNDLKNSKIPKLFKRQAWKSRLSTLRAYVNRIRGKQSAPNFESVTIPFRWTVPSRTKTASEYRAFIERDASNLCIFTGSWPYNYKDQHADAFPDITFGDNIQILYLENTDHVFPLSQDRQLLTNSVSAWLLDRFVARSNGIIDNKAI